MKIGIDIDGVLTDIGRAILDYGTKYCYENNIEYKIDLKNYYENEILGISDDNTNNFWNKYLGDYVQNCMTRTYAAEVIAKLRQNNDIYIITGRNEEGLCKELYGTMQKLTKKWLENNEIEYDEIIFSGSSKKSACVENGINIMIEDSPSVIAELVGVVPVLCFDAPYNKNVTNDGVTRVYSWYDILHNVT